MSNIRDAFTKEERIKAALAIAKAETDKAVAPVIIACKNIWDWMTVDNPDRRGWVPRGHHPHPAPKPRIDRWIEEDRVIFSISRMFEGSERHGSGDLYYEEDFTVPLTMIERGDFEELERYITATIKAQGAKR